MIRKLIPALLCLPFLLVACQHTKTRSLQKGTIKIDLFSDKPVFKNIIHASDTLSPAVGQGLTVNGVMKPWNLWYISSLVTGDTLIYRMALKQPDLTADFVYWIDSTSVRMRIRNVADKSGTLKEIGLEEQSWVTVSDTAWRWRTVKNWTREPFVPKKVFSRGIGMVIAEDDERFVPTHGGIYAYSRHGADRDWLLPKAFRNRKLKVYELTGTGKKDFTAYSVSDNKIRIKLTANQSVKIEVD